MKKSRKTKKRKKEITNKPFEADSNENIPTNRRHICLFTVNIYPW